MSAAQRNTHHGANMAPPFFHMRYIPDDCQPHACMTDRHESEYLSHLSTHRCGPAGGGDERRGLVEALVKVLGERDLGNRIWLLMTKS